MPDEQDRAEALDGDKRAFPAHGPDGVDVLDQTADSPPDTGSAARSAIDGGETGDDLDGVESVPDGSEDPFHAEEPAPEVAAMHIEDSP